MESFVARRVVKRYEHQISAPPESVFPLLCPIAEAPWRTPTPPSRNCTRGSSTVRSRGISTAGSQSTVAATPEQLSSRPRPEALRS